MKLIKTKKIIDKDLKLDFFTIFIGSAAYSGFFPVASGTVGSAFALVFLFINGFYSPYVIFTFILIFFFTGIIVSDRMMLKYGEDPSVVVIDEVVGQWLSLGIASLFFSELLLSTIVISFITFRFFDVLKVFPARYFDKLKSGYGIMMDDVIAGIYSGFVTLIAIKLLKILW